MIDNSNDHVDEGDRDEHLDPDADPRREYDEWIDEITRRPWFVALESLPDDSGLWVGTENELMSELRARAGGDAEPPEDFPSGVGELLERPHRDVEYAFRKARLDVVDYRKLEDEYRAIYDVPGWGRKAPMLVRRGTACFKPSHEGAIYQLKRYGNPLAIAVVRFTFYGKEFKKSREWSGRTRELAERLKLQRVNMLGHPERSREVQEMLELNRSGDFRRFGGMMRTSAYLLKGVGVKVSWEKAKGRNPISGEEYAYTLWTVEAPNWAPRMSRLRW